MKKKKKSGKKKKIGKEKNNKQTSKHWKLNYTRHIIFLLIGFFSNKKKFYQRRFASFVLHVVFERI